VRMYTREGCRGGSENFKWDQLKTQEFKDREQYLGASTKVGMMAKFGRYYVHDWYARKRDTAESIEEERGTVQQYEEELMQEALGLKPKKLLLAKKQLSEEELKEFLKKDGDRTTDKGGREMMGPQRKTVTDAQGNEVDPDALYTTARVNGLGFAAHRNAKLEKYKAETLGTEAKLEGIKSESIKVEVKQEDMTDTECLRLGPALKKEEEGMAPKSEVEAEVKDEPPDSRKAKRQREEVEEGSQERNQRKLEKKEKKAKKQKKAEKKAKKKLKKAAKKVKKAAKLAATGTKTKPRSSDSSDSSSS